ncbi:tagatose-bisphosphate aldolase [Trichoderma reesei QM6a]|uniref:Fructose-bisphosphate aldolase n=2 Tax=Hypocrea jecorina TaxID=51453 RepID=G0RN82_HYPJQ|nr:tagatose-bisphosphate aldolase [Trichoderma reesei QM6a]EGR47339.1 tagatose-bisphosphate aldolase [Trichoderma reesei QM6a]
MMASSSLEDNTTLRILRAADKGNYGVLAAVGYNLEQILGFVRAAERKRSPLIIQLFPWAIAHSDGVLVHAAAQAARQASVPVAVHLDHCQDEAMVRRACELPFDSVMVDMSHHSKEDNLRKTRELVAYCHERGKAAEAEPGRIEGGEDGVSDTLDLEGLMTTMEEARGFVDAGVDLLAPAFGNVHGEYGPRGIVLDFERLKQVHEITSASNVLIALHGVTGFSEELLRQLIEAGVRKINVNKDILMGYYAVLEQRINKAPFTQVVDEAIEQVAEALARQMDAVGSSGKAY